MKNYIEINSGLVSDADTIECILNDQFENELI